MTAVLKHELSSYYHSLAAYIFSACLMIFVGIGAMIYNIQASVSNFEYVLQFVCIGLVIIVPVLTMRVFAEEKKLKTIQLLYSLPLKSTQIVLGKFLSSLIIFAIPMIIISFYPLIFSAYGEVYLPTSYGSIAAFFILGASMISIGMFISTLTENQGFAAGIAIGIFLFNYYSVKLSEYISTSSVGTIIALAVIGVLIGFLVKHVTKNSNAGFYTALVIIALVCVISFVNNSLLDNILPNIMSKLSLFEHFSTFINGIFDMTSIVFYASVIIFFLFLSVQSLEKRRYN